MCDYELLGDLLNVGLWQVGGREIGHELLQGLRAQALLNDGRELARVLARKVLQRMGEQLARVDSLEGILFDLTAKCQLGECAAAHLKHRLLLILTLFAKKKIKIKFLKKK